MRDTIRRLMPAAAAAAFLAGCDGEEPVKMETDPTTNPPGVNREIPPSEVEGESKADTLDANETKRD